MTNYTTITDYSFKFCDHPFCPIFSNSLNNMYAEPFENTVTDQLFTNANKTTVVNDALVVIRSGIIDTIFILSTADRTIVSSSVNQMHLFAFDGNPHRKFPVWSPNTITTYFNAVIGAGHTYAIFQLNTASVFVDPNNFTVLDFVGLSLSSPVRHINAASAPGVLDAGAGTATGSTPPTDAQVIAAAIVTAKATNQALIAQQAATIVAITATLPTEFNLNDLPPDAKARYENHLGYYVLDDQKWHATFSDSTWGSVPCFVLPQSTNKYRCHSTTGFQSSYNSEWSILFNDRPKK